MIIKIAIGIAVGVIIVGLYFAVKGLLGRKDEPKVEPVTSTPTFPSLAPPTPSPIINPINVRR